MHYIAYYRVSTRQQGASGLGLEAQQQAVHRFLASQDTLLQEYTEVESGKRNDRPQLQAAIEHVRETTQQQLPVKLIIAKLDRLSRNASFIFALRDSKVPFLAADMPDANNLTVGIMAVLADHERQMISERTQAALQALIKRGKQLGTPENLTDEDRALGRSVVQFKARQHPRNRQAGAMALLLHQQGENYSHIARQLNGYGFTTRKNKAFTHVQVKRLIERYQDNVPEHLLNVQTF